MENFPTFTNDLKCELKWLNDNNNDNEKISGIKNQKFLLFYNLFLKVKKQQGNFEGLCAWKGGPVYTQVHAAIKHHFTIQQIIDSIGEEVDIDTTLAKIAKFIVELLSDEEVSELTHKFDFWKTIDNNYEKNEIKEENISKDDEKKILKLLEFYDINFINEYRIFKTDDTVFFIKNREYDFVVNNLYCELKKIKNDKPVKINLKSKKIHKLTELHKLSV